MAVSPYSVEGAMYIAAYLRLIRRLSNCGPLVGSLKCYLVDQFDI